MKDRRETAVKISRKKPLQREAKKSNLRYFLEVVYKYNGGVIDSHYDTADNIAKIIEEKLNTLPQGCEIKISKF